MSAAPAAVIVHNALKPSDAVHALARALGDPRVVHTRTLEEGLLASRAAVEEGAALLVAAGGDGTLLSAVTAAAGTDTAVGVLPLGTANDLARHLGLTAPANAIAALVRPRIERVDSFELTATRDGQPARWIGCTTAGAGLFAEVVRQEFTPEGQALLARVGPAAWLWFTLRIGLAGAPVPVRLLLDGEPHELDALTVDLFKVPAMGGFPVIPGARLDSGELHGWAGTLRSRPGRIGALLQGLVRTGGHLGRTDVIGWGSPDGVRTTELALECAQDLPVHVHGELVGTTPLQARCRPANLRLVVGAQPEKE